MVQPLNNHAFIDGNNVHMALKDLGWKLDYRRFRVYLREHYRIDKAYYFIGFIPEQSELYSKLQDAGFLLVFKPTIPDGSGKPKGNVDAELVLQAMINRDIYESALIVSGDGDFACLVRYLKEQRKLRGILVPNLKRYSGLLKKAAGSQIAGIDALKRKLEYSPKNEKHP